MSLTISEFISAVTRDKKLLLQAKCPEGVVPCTDCGIPLQSAITGRNVFGGGNLICDDCVDVAMGGEIDSHPHLRSAFSPAGGAKNMVCERTPA